MAAECVELLPLVPEAAAALLEPVVERMLAEGTAVAVCTAFRHVAEPLQFRRETGGMTLREIIRRTNLQVARLSQRTGCFVLDLDRPWRRRAARCCTRTVLAAAHAPRRSHWMNSPHCCSRRCPTARRWWRPDDSFAGPAASRRADESRAPSTAWWPAVGSELRPGVPLLEVRVDLQSDQAQDCPPLYFFRLIATERGVLRACTWQWATWSTPAPSSARSPPRPASPPRVRQRGRCASHPWPSRSIRFPGADRQLSCRSAS